MSMEKIDSDPNLGSSPAMRVGAYNAVNRSAEESNVNAGLKGQETDQAAEERAANIMDQNQKLSYDRNMFNRGNYQLNQQPSAFEALMSTGFANTLGQAVQKGLNPTTDTTTKDTTAGASDTSGQNYLNNAYGSPSQTPSLGYQPQNWDLGSYAPPQSGGYNTGNAGLDFMNPASNNYWDAGSLVPKPVRY